MTLDRAAAIVRASETSKSQVHELDGKTNAIRRQNSQYKQNLPQNQTQLRRTPQFPRKSNPISILPAATNNFFKQAKNRYYCGTKHG